MLHQSTNKTYFLCYYSYNCYKKGCPILGWTNQIILYGTRHKRVPSVSVMPLSVHIKRQVKAAPENTVDIDIICLVFKFMLLDIDN